MTSKAAAAEATKTVVTDIFEPDVPVERVELDALVALKIIRHARSAVAGAAPIAGQLLGIDTASLLTVSDTFALPGDHLFPSSLSTLDQQYDAYKKRTDDFDGAAARAVSYTNQMLPRLESLHADVNVVGFYTSTSNGQTVTSSGALVEALARWQAGFHAPTSGKRLAIRPTDNRPKKGVALVFDSSSVHAGTISIRAFRLTDAYLNTYKSGKSDAQSLSEHALLPTNVLREYPVTITRTALLTAFLSTLVAPDATRSAVPSLNAPQARDTALPAPTFAALALPAPSSTQPASLTQPLSALVASFEKSVGVMNNLNRKWERRGGNRAQETYLDALKDLAAADGAATAVADQTQLDLVRAYGIKAGFGASA
ncbi:uncharacterized protein L969DRAFT_93969 [Mixia osmundae IAM 14324]|uniref:JAB1/MPN/MOV34 metalloenzyme domain-containing protein n=1 Tax=Mixia osmundae (strain CBS 9802 / IAM 14324 / JCM 22182 / KY 12970) TaxID=764103 RepID=G7E8P2_MIXOS|nr:uncharacterized protein L969DRAFT_93969 [Mixia osmundae IAM 14324]KEI40146.1 hypothetical protein L969DRAFT_93969 [Mixia osmundae IAM 14324]GAA99510.1 hypothetical protein E5Q_06211 [Mixia osmundae IAM 14324]